MYAVIKEILRINAGLELGSVRKPLAALVPEDAARVQAAAAHIRRAVEQFA